jgi:hypothetical protein
MVRAQFKFWRRHPPMYRLLASYVGFKPEAEIDVTEEHPADSVGMKEMMREFASDVPAHLRAATDLLIQAGG